MNVRDNVEEVVAAIASGEVVGIATDTVYGIGGLALDPEIAARIFDLKQRPGSAALAVLIADPPDAERLVGRDLGVLLKLSNAFWPGPLTIVARRRADLDLVLGGDETTIGVRCPALEVTRSVIRRTGPLVVTSANRTGGLPATTPEAVAAIFGDGLVTLDGGVCDASPSTVVSVSGGVPVVLRRGSVDERAIRDALGAP